MSVVKTDFPCLMIIEPKVFGDSHGYFLESYNEKAIADAGIQTVYRQGKALPTFSEVETNFVYAL